MTDSKLPQGRYPISDKWFAQKVAAMDEHRDFPNNTCPSSRHVQLIAETLYSGEEYHMLTEDPAHCADSIATVISSLYQARTMLQSLGYTWRMNNDVVEWYKEDTTTPNDSDDADYLGRAARNNMTNPGNLDYEI